MVQLGEVLDKPFACAEIGSLQKELEDLLSEVTRNRKFWAKLQRIAAEYAVTPAKVLMEGVEDWRRKMRLINGPLAKRFKDPEQLMQYSQMQSLAGQMAAEVLGEEGIKQRAIRGGKARAANLRKKNSSVKKRSATEKSE
jgi:hypothetical protein